MPIPLKDLMKMPTGSYEFYEPEASYQKLMVSAKSYACRARVKVKTEKYRCITANDDTVKTLVKVTVTKAKAS